MSIPVDPDDSEVDYVLIQYVAEFMRAAGYAGIVYGSALGPGTNLVLFDGQGATPISTRLIRVTSVRYTMGSVDQPSVA